MVSFVLANANSFHETQMFPDKPQRFLQHFLNANADFAFITATHFTPMEAHSWSYLLIIQLQAAWLCPHPIPTRMGVTFSNTCTDPNGRWIVATVHANHFPPPSAYVAYMPPTQDKTSSSTMSFLLWLPTPLYCQVTSTLPHKLLIAPHLHH